MSDSTRPQIVQFIASYCLENFGNSPSFRQIQSSINLSHGSTRRHLLTLVRDGALIKKRGKYILAGCKYVLPDGIDLDPSFPIPTDNNEAYDPSGVRSMYLSQKGKCWWCGCELLGVYHIDHRVARAKGGTSDPGNLCLACPDCNSRKSDKMPWEFNGRLL